MITRVAAAVITRPDGQVLLAQRPPGKAYAGYWEFPGGKLEPGEAPAHALARELHEELGLEVTRAAPWFVQEYVYPHAHVELHFFRVLGWKGEPVGHDGQAFAWQVPGAFDVAPLLPANTRVMAALELPMIYGITCASDSSEDAFLARAEAALRGGLRLIQVREKEWPAARIERFALAMRDLARPYGARVLLNGDEQTARELGLDGVHWTAAKLASGTLATSTPASGVPALTTRATAMPANLALRSKDLLVGASCHTREDLARAAALNVDFAVLGPVHATPTHPKAAPLGWEGFAALREGARLPVYALGGLSATDLDTAIDHGAHGVALRRGAWPDR